MKKILLTTLAVLFFFPVCVMAQDEWGPQVGNWELTLQGNGTSSVDFDTTDAAVEGGLAYFVTKNLELGVRQGVSWMNLENADDIWNGSTRLFVDYSFDLKRFRPFFGVSTGYLYGDSTDDSWIAGPEAGVKYYVFPKAFLYLLCEYNFTFKNSDKIDEAYDDGRFAYAIGFGVNW